MIIIIKEFKINVKIFVILGLYLKILIAIIFIIKTITNGTKNIKPDCLYSKKVVRIKKQGNADNIKDKINSINKNLWFAFSSLKKLESVFEIYL
jgi:hypothetical protein